MSSSGLVIRAALLFLGCVVAVGTFGGVIGYLDSRTKQVARDQERLRILKESISKGSGGDIARAEAKELEAKINGADDDGRAALRAREQATTWGVRTALVGLLPLGAWAFTQRLKSTA